MLLIFSTTPETKIYEAIAPILKTKPCEVACVNNPVAVQLIAPKAGAILTMGPEAFKELQEAKVVPKNRTVTSYRKRALPWLRPTMCTYSPGIKNVDYRQYVDMLTDVNMAFRLAATGKLEPTLGKYRWVPNLKELINAIKVRLLTQSTVDLSIDSETVGLDPLHPDRHVVSLQFSVQAGTADCVYFPTKEASDLWLRDFENQRDLAWLLNEPRIRTSGANFKYDLSWLYWKAGLECTNFTFDTTLVGSLLDENRSNGLDIHAKIYCPELSGYSDEFDQTIDKARMDLVPQEKLLPYAGGDADAALRVKHAQREELVQDEQLTKFYLNVLHPAARAFEVVERGGVFIDMPEYERLEADLQVSILDSIKEAKRIMGGRIVAKHMDEDKFGGINLTKASLLNDFMFTPMGLGLKPKLFTEKTQQPAAGMDHLEMFENVPEAAEFIKVLKDFQSASKTLQTYVTGFKKHIRSDGRFHPNHFLFVGDRDEGEGGTNTGRISVRDPAIQTVPKHTKWGKRIRKVFCAPPGHRVVEADYAQGELKVIACLAHEDTMIKAYMDGLDLHVITSAFGAGFSYEEMLALKKSDKPKFDALRQLGKAGNFGLIYGMGVEGFMEYARLNYGVTLTYQEAQSFRDGFFARYPRLVDYHKQYKAFARKHGYVRGPLGRIRHLPLISSGFSDIRSKAERNAINSPVQGTLSDLMLWAIAEMATNYDPMICQPVTAIHDAGYYYVPEDDGVEWAKRIVGTMENLPLEKVDWYPQLKFTADAKIGMSMGALEELHF